MSELRRWSDEGATAGELSLLDASRSERAPADARARVFKAFGISAAVTTAVTATTTASATTAGVALLTKIVGISLLASGLVVGGLLVRSSRIAALPSSPALIPTSVAPTAPPAEPAVPVMRIAAPAPLPAASTRAASPPRSARGASQDDRLSQEVVALERAHRALASHDPEAALRMLDRYRAQFPAGALSSEATVLRVQALLARGDRAGAQTLADAYSAAHPDSPYARRIEDLVRGGQKE